MCQKEGCCEKPQNLKENPEECSPEQIKKCHGTSGEHPCCGVDQDCETEGKAS